LDAAQSAEVLGWPGGSASDFGFTTDQWTAPRVAGLIETRFGVVMNHRYLNDWLRRRGVTPQMPEPKAVERDERAIEAWVRYRWPRVKKRRGNSTPALFSRTNRAPSPPRWRAAASRPGA
jgi:transposase